MACMDHPTLAGHHFPCHNNTEISLKISSVAPNICHQPLSRSSGLRLSLVKEKRQIVTIQHARNIKWNPGEEAGITNGRTHVIQKAFYHSLETSLYSVRFSCNIKITRWNETFETNFVNTKLVSEYRICGLCLVNYLFSLFNFSNHRKRRTPMPSS